MNNIYKKQDNHKTDKWGNIIPHNKNKKEIKKPPINNPFKEIFGKDLESLKGLKK